MLANVVTEMSERACRVGWLWWWWWSLCILVYSKDILCSQCHTPRDGEESVYACVFIERINRGAIILYTRRIRCGPGRLCLLCCASAAAVCNVVWHHRKSQHRGHREGKLELKVTYTWRTRGSLSLCCWHACMPLQITFAYLV